MTPGVCVIGVGNRDRGDDAIGPLVADAAAARFGAAVTTMVVEGDLADLSMRWPLDGHVVVVDAVMSGAPAGTLHVVDDPATTHTSLGTRPDGVWSTHGIGLGEAIELARLLDRLPTRLTVIGVEAAHFEHGEPPGTAVAAAVEPVLDAIGRSVS